MKKLLVVLLFMLSGCSSEERKSADMWALGYTEQVYIDDYGGYGMYAYMIEPYIAYESALDDCTADYSCYLYKITILDYSGDYVIYNVIIGFEQSSVLEKAFGVTTFTEESIIDCDVEEQE